MLAGGGAGRRGCVLILAGQLAGCAAPGAPLPINAVALGRLSPEQVLRPVNESARPSARPVVATALPRKPGLGATGGDARRELRLGTANTTAVPRAPEAEQPRTSEVTPVPAAAADFSPLSPVANPVPLEPPGGARATGRPMQTAHDTMLAPGSSLCDLNDGSTAADVALYATPCPADLRPTLRPSEPLE